MAVPANVGPPKTIVFRYPGLEQKLHDQFVYQAYASVAEVTKQRFIPGNRLVLKFNEEVIGEGQIILVEKVTSPQLGFYPAVVLPMAALAAATWWWINRGSARRRTAAIPSSPTPASW